MAEAMERIGWKADWTIWKWDVHDLDSIGMEQFNAMSVEERMKDCPERLSKEEHWENNLALNEGLAEMIDIIIGAGSPTKFDNTNAYLGVGNSNTAAQATDTGLIGASKSYKAMVATYPQRSNQTATWRAEFGTSDANYAWEEFTVANGSSDSAKNLNRKVESKGTKSSGETWTLQIQITFS